MSCSSNRKIRTLLRGSTHPLKMGFKDNTELTDDWTCRLQVRVQSTKEITIVNREVITKSPDNTRFITMLTGLETNSLGAGVYVIGFEITNSVTGEILETSTPLEIVEDWVYEDSP